MLSPTRRRHLWQHLDFLDFSDTDFIYCPRRNNHPLDDETVFHQLNLQCNTLESRLVNFINAVLSLRRTRDVRKFRLSCTYSYGMDFYYYSLDQWILALVGPHHLQEFQLSLAPYSFNVFVLPVSVFSCTSLVSLSLFGAIILPTLSSVHLPSLKTLEVHVFNMQPGSIYTILAGCHVLESLYLAFTSLVIDVPMIVVPSSVKRFTFVDDTLSEIEHLEIDTPSLQYLNITINNLCTQYSVRSLENVVEAHLDIYLTDWHFDLVLNLLLAMRKTKFLALGRSTIECLCLFHDPALDFPKFGYLLHLELVLPNLNVSFLLDILQKCPMLQVLTIEKDKKHRSSFLRSWTLPTTVPNCLVSHLTMIIFKGYQGSPEEEAFTSYILLRGLVLKTMTIHTDFSLDLEEKHRIFEQLSDIPKASNMCQLVFP